MNSRIVAAEYAVRGEIVLKAMEYDTVLARGGAAAAALPFDRTIACNIGNPQSLGQKPITFHRQVLSLVNYPAALGLGSDSGDDDHGLPGDPAAQQTATAAATAALYPADAVARARAFLAANPAGTGAYSESKGVAMCRRDVAAFLARRDGHAADPNDIFLTDGAR
jgi:alanine transaminase